MYNTHFSGEAWVNVGGHAHSETFDYNLGNVGENYVINSDNYNPDGKYTVPGDDGISDNPDDPEGTTSDDISDTNQTDNATDDSEGPTLDLPLPAPSVYLSMFGFAAIVIIRKKRM